MAIKAVLVLAVVFYFSCYGMVEGLHRKLSMEEDLEIEKQLKLLNKPSLKSITTENGDLYDCVDFFKQPAFDHPLLQNHTYHLEMRPSFLNKTKTKKQSETVKNQFGLPGGGCPIGTVPIRRTTKDDLINVKAVTDATELRRAVLRTRKDPNKKYYGAGASFSVYNLQVSPSQYSSSQITIQNEADTIQVGWTVNPALYGDTKTRLFTFFRAGGSPCFNTRCPGFVIVNTQVPLDAILEPVSERGKHIRDVHFFVQQDEKNGNWWLQLGEDNMQVGFWPQRIFSGLKDFATYVDWGGEAYGGVQEKPQMGSGHKLEGDTDYDAFGRLIRIVNENHNVANAVFTQTFTNSIFYEIEDWGLRGDNGLMIVFGGPK